MSKEDFAWTNNENVMWITNYIESNFGPLEAKQSKIRQQPDEEVG